MRSALVEVRSYFYRQPTGRAIGRTGETVIADKKTGLLYDAFAKRALAAVLSLNRARGGPGAPADEVTGRGEAMGLFNVVRGRITCPRCGAGVEAEVETRLGYLHDALTLRVGDRYPWNHPDMPSRRPDGGNAVGDGYAVCPACGRDFFVNVAVAADVIRGLEHDATRAGMIPDG